MSMTAERQISNLFDELVPNIGAADTVAGEIVRAVSRIGYRSYNDGDHIGIGYGNQTCNPAARYLVTMGDETITNIICMMWGTISDSVYEAHLEALMYAVLRFLREHPELKQTVNNDDMWNYRRPEDSDCWGDDDEFADDYDDDEWR